MFRIFSKLRIFLFLHKLCKTGNIPGSPSRREVWADALLPEDHHMSRDIWAGLDSMELRRVELMFCPPIYRAQLQEAPVNEPLARCGFMLGKILDYIEHINAQRTTSQRRLLPRNKELAELLDEQPSFVSRLLTGRAGNQKPGPDVWFKCRKIFRALLLGNGLGETEKAPEAAREVIHRRMENYFFGPESSATGPFFSADFVEIPQTANEGAYHLVWLGMQSLGGQLCPELTVASGGPAYAFSRGNELTPIGKGAFYALLCGVKIFFVIPKLPQRTPAEEPAEEFLRLILEKVRTRTNFWTIQAMASACGKTTPVCSEVVLRANVKILVLPLGSGNIKGETSPTWPGQFLTAGVRFVRIPFQRQDHVFAVRSVHHGPFAFELDENETAAFRLWEKTYVFSRVRKPSQSVIGRQL